MVESALTGPRARVTTPPSMLGASRPLWVNVHDGAKLISFPPQRLWSWAELSRFEVQVPQSVQREQLRHVRGQLTALQVQFDLRRLELMLQRRFRLVSPLSVPDSEAELRQSLFPELHINAAGSTLICWGVHHPPQCRPSPFYLEAALHPSPQGLRIDVFRGFSFGVTASSAAVLAAEILRAAQLPALPSHPSALQVDPLTELSLAMCLERGWKLPARERALTARASAGQLILSVGDSSEPYIPTGAYAEHLKRLKHVSDGEQMLYRGEERAALQFYQQLDPSPFSLLRVAELIRSQALTPIQRAEAVGWLNASLKPNDPLAPLARSWQLELRGELEGASEALEEWWSLAAGLPEVSLARDLVTLRGVAAYSRALLLEHTAPARALEAFEEARAALPSSLGVLSGAARVAIALSKTALADERLSEQAQLLESRDLHHEAAWAWVQVAEVRRSLANTPDQRAAERAFSRALELEPSLISAHQGLAALAEERGDYELACERLDYALRQVVTQGPARAALEEMRQRLDQLSRPMSALAPPRAQAELRESTTAQGLKLAEPRLSVPLERRPKSPIPPPPRAQAHGALDAQALNDAAVVLSQRGATRPAQATTSSPSEPPAPPQLRSPSPEPKVSPQVSPDPSPRRDAELQAASSTPPQLSAPPEPEPEELIDFDDSLSGDFLQVDYPATSLPPQGSQQPEAEPERGEMTPPLSSIDPVEIDLNAEEAALTTQVSVEQPSAPLALQKTPVLELPVTLEAEEPEGDEEDDPLASFVDVDEVSAELLNVEAWEEAVPSSMTRSAEPGPLMGELLEAEPLTGQPEQAQREAPLSSQHNAHQDDQALNSHEPDDSVSQLDLADVWQSDEGWELKTEISAFPQTQADAPESLTGPQIEEPKDPPEGAQLASMKLNYAHLEGDERWEVALEIAQFARDEELNLEEAQRFYWEALRAPDSQRELTSVAAEELAELLTVSQDHRGMLSLYEEMLKRSLKPAAELHRLKALTLNTLGHKEEALAALEQSVAAGGDGSVELRVSILTELGHVEEAVSQLDAAAGAYEGNQRPQAMRARAIYLAQAAGLLKESYPQEALIRLKEAYQSDKIKERLEHWHRLALSVGDPYDQVEATEAYVERLAQEPDSLSLRERLLSKLAQELEEPSPMHSLALYREALELNPESFEVADKLCELSIKMEALEPLSLGLKRLLPLCLEGEFKGRLFVRLAYTLGALGDVEGAEEQLRCALVELMTEGGALEEPRELSEVILWGRAMCTEAVAEPLNQLISSSPISAHLNI